MIMWYDVLALGVLLFFALRGAMRGFIFQIASLAGIVLCFVFADAVSNAAGPYIHLDPPMNHWVALVASYLGFTFLCYLAARMLNEWLEKCKLKEFDRHLGVVFGLVKGVVLVLILTFFIVTVSESARASLKGSHTGRYCAILMDRLEPVLPERLHVALEDYIHLLDSPDLPLIHSHDPFPPDAGSDFTLGSPASIPKTSNPNPAAADLWTQLKGLFSNESQQVVTNALQNADPQTREKIQQNLQSVVSSIPAQERESLQQQIIQVGAGELQQFLDWRLGQLGTPVSPATPTPNPATPNPATPNPATPNPIPNPAMPPASNPSVNPNEQLTLMRDIAGVYSTLPNIRQNIEQDIQRRINGVPEAISRAALNDWKADLLRIQPDPDPQTGAEASVEIRILRQMQIQGVRIDQLGADVQQRLRSAQAQSSSSEGPV